MLLAFHDSVEGFLASSEIHFHSHPYRARRNLPFSDQCSCYARIIRLARDTLMAAIIEKVKKECPHCEILLTKKSYDAHKRLYYDENTGWIKKRRLTSDEEHSRVSATEQAIEQCAFDHGLEEDQTRIEIDAPPLVDFCDEIAETTNRYEGDCTCALIHDFLYWVGILCKGVIAVQLIPIASCMSLCLL